MIEPRLPAMATHWSAAIGTTLTLMVVTIAIATPIGLIAGLTIRQLTKRNSQPLGARPLAITLQAGLLVAALLPLIIHAAAWETTLGRFGVWGGAESGRWLRGDGKWLSVAWIHGIHGAAIIALTTAAVLRRIDPSIVAAATLDTHSRQRWWRVWLPVAGTPIALAICGVGLLAATDMSVADLYSLRTVADQFYLFHVVDPAATSIASVTLLPILLGWLPWGLLRHSGWPNQHGRPTRSTTLRAGRRSVADPLAFAGGLFSIGLLTIPAIGLVIQISRVSPGGSILQTIGATSRALASSPGDFANELRWTWLLSATTGIIATLVAAAFVAATDRWRGLVPWVHAGGIAIWLIPGPLVGSFVATALTGPGDWRTTLATQTLLPTVLACLPKSLVVAYAVLAVAVARIDPTTRRAARLDAGPWTRLMHGPGRLLWAPAAIAMLLSGLIGGGDVAAQLPVLPPGVVTVGTRLFALLHSGARYQEATLTLAQATLITAAVAVVIAISRFHRPREPIPSRGGSG